MAISRLRAGAVRSGRLRKGRIIRLSANTVRKGYVLVLLTSFEHVTDLRIAYRKWQGGC
jgi:hypothetical protein